jgi:hypothetical protein
MWSIRRAEPMIVAVAMPDPMPADPRCRTQCPCAASASATTARPKPPQAVLTRATLDFGLFDALGELNSRDAQAAVEPC